MNGTDTATLTVSSFVAGLAQRFADRPAVVLGTEILTYQQWESASGLAAAGLLKRTVTKGARIGLLLGNGPDWVTVWAAIVRSGAVAVPLSTLYSPTELQEVVRDADLTGLIHHDSYRGADTTAVIAAAFPSLQEAGPDLLLDEAPELRWIVTTGAVKYTWQRPMSWLTHGVTEPDRERLRVAESGAQTSEACCMLFTSGTTAMPKGVIHTHDSMLSQVEFVRDMLRFREGTRCYCPMPFFWLAGQLHGLFPVLAAGGTSYCTRTSSPAEVLELIPSEQIDRIYMVRSQYERLAEDPAFRSSDRRSVTIAFPTELLASDVDPEERSGRVCRGGYYMGLGMSETYGPYWFGPSVTQMPDPQNDLYPDVPPLTLVAPGFDLAIVTDESRVANDGEVGEICVRGRGVMRGLNKRDMADVFDVNGYYHTGDLALVAGGRAYYRGRVGDIIKTAGASVSAAEVERAIEKICPVSRVCVVGIPDRRRGHVIAAAVVPAVVTGGADIAVQELLAELSSSLSRYKVPKYIAVLSEEQLPLTPSSRIQRRQLADLIRQRMRQEGLVDD